MGLVPNRIIVPNNLYPFVGIQMTLHHRPEFPEDMEKNPRQIYPIYLVVHPTNRKWVITPFITGISRVSPLITRVITHLLSGMSHQVEQPHGIPLIPYCCCWPSKNDSLVPFVSHEYPLSPRVNSTLK